MLNPKIQIIRLCGRQKIILRGHLDYGRITKEEPTNSYGNFRYLLGYHAKYRDTRLKEHLKTSGSNAMYISPLIQNEIINNFGELILVT